MIALLRRVALVSLLCLTTFAIAVDAQPAKVPRLGILDQDAPPTPGSRNTFRDMMRELGYIYGQNLIVEERFAEGRNERFPSLAAELVALKPDVILADSTPGAIAAMHATATIPIVIVNVSDPVGSGLVASLARPGGNITGVTGFPFEMAEKFVELVHVIVPKATRIAVLMSDHPVHPSHLKVIQAAAKTIGLTVLPTMARSPENFEEAFASMAKQDAQALLVLAGAPFDNTHREWAKIVELAARTKLPTLYTARQFAEAGGLLSFSPNRWLKWRLTAGYVDKVLKGAKPADLPVEQPSVFDLVINLKTAKALGLTIPQSILLRADEVIQ